MKNGNLVLRYRGIVKDPSHHGVPDVLRVWAQALEDLESLLAFIEPKRTLTLPKLLYAYPAPSQVIVVDNPGKQHRVLQRVVENWPTIIERQVGVVSVLNSETTTSYASSDWWRKWVDNKQPRNLQGRPIRWFRHYQIKLDENPKEIKSGDYNRSLLKLVVWEVYENNARADIKSLEEHYRGEQRCRDGRELHLRDELLSRIVPFGEFWVGGILPEQGEGLGGNDIWQRLPYMYALAQLEQYWPDLLDGTTKPAVYGGTLTDIENNRTLCQRFEEEVVRFYVRSFFYVYLRIPVAPHILPEAGDRSRR